MLQQLLDDLRGHFESKPSLSEEEKSLLNRLKEDVFPILFLQREDLARTGFDAHSITSEQMRRLANEMGIEYYKEEYWSRLEEKADDLELTRYLSCPACNHNRIKLDIQEGVLRCEACDQTWREEMYVLVEFPNDASHFEENDIGYPSFDSKDNGARYVSEYDYILNFQKAPAENACYKPLRWPESQSYLFPDEPNESVDALCEPVWDEKGIADFGEQAVWVPLCNIKN